jgi:hypothetical protein
MASKRSPQTAAKREREQAVRERRERKREKKQAAAMAKALGEQPAEPGFGDESPVPAEANAE